MSPDLRPIKLGTQAARCICAVRQQKFKVRNQRYSLRPKLSCIPDLVKVNVTKAIGNNEERKGNHNTETQDFNVENPLQQREVKPRAQASKTSLYWEFVYKRRGLSYDAINPSRRLTRNIYRRR
jgi:hypothetical protein